MNNAWSIIRNRQSIFRAPSLDGPEGEGDESWITLDSIYKFCLPIINSLPPKRKNNFNHCQKQKNQRWKIMEELIKGNLMVIIADNLSDFGDKYD